MGSQQERADHEVLNDKDTGVIEGMQGIQGIDQQLTPLQYHCLSLLQRLIALKNSYQTDSNFEPWLMASINKAIYATLRDSIETNIGDAAKELLRREHQVN